MFNSIFANTLFFLAIPVIGAQLSPLTEISHVDGIGSAYTVTGKVSISLREVRTEIMGANGPKALSVLVMLEPRSGVYSWRTFDADPNNTLWRIKQLNHEQALFLRNGELIHFMSLPCPARLFIHRNHGRASNMNDAVAKALKTASESIDFQGDMEQGQGVHVISMLSLGREFTVPPMSSIPCGVSPKVTNVRWNGMNWIVTLEARWDAVVTLDSKYDVVSMKKVE